MTVTIALCRPNVVGDVVGLSHLVPSQSATSRRQYDDATAECAAVLLLTEVGMPGKGDEPAVSRGEQIQAAERDAAKRRLLAEAEADRIPVEETTRAMPDRRWRRGRC
ncbi:hypothetical protein E1211_04435 [Micromonospora sp. 15K316]|uniref:hypothetical protein n=1 Tax=Micromonospora sp. 15K316 TaxID=2530376 RepID=UPI00104EDA32|nr:hypothetical protein [Micromonospora sp. 15K316]TDC39417.1 hypothetical protein E1211_04435 [Micromonospora sp. 15K316]